MRYFLIVIAHEKSWWIAKAPCMSLVVGLLELRGKTPVEIKDIDLQLFETYRIDGLPELKTLN